MQRPAGSRGRAKILKAAACSDSRISLKQPLTILRGFDMHPKCLGVLSHMRWRHVLYSHWEHSLYL
jgi:hypothetical protein